MRLFDKIKKELIGKYAYSKGNIKFKIEGVMYSHQSISEKVDSWWAKQLRDICFSYLIGGILIFGKDENGNNQELILNEIQLLEFNPIKK
jgi:hypothetical protein